MYGIINRAIQDLDSESFGEEKWEWCRFFYQTRNLRRRRHLAAGGCSKLPRKNTVAWWNLAVTTWKNFWRICPCFITGLWWITPNLPHEFTVRHLVDKGIIMHYRSKRIGLQVFVRGTLSGPGKMYETPIDIELIHSRDEGSDHEVFKIILLG